jgi:Tfp pilus assembly protein PilO
VLKPLGKHDSLSVLCHGAGAAITLLLAAGAWYAAPWLLGSWRQSLAERSAAAEAIAEERPRIPARHAAAAEKCRAAEASLAQLKERIPAKLDTSEFYRLVSRAAKEQSVELGDVRPQEHRALGQFEKHKWRMTARGAFLDVCRFMQAVEELPIQCFVDDVSINGSAADERQMSLELGIVGFSRKPPAPPAVPAAANAPAAHGARS